MDLLIDHELIFTLFNKLLAHLNIQIVETFDGVFEVLISLLLVEEDLASVELEKYA